MSLIFATQLTAVATAVLAVFAIVTAVYAVRAFRKQSQEVSAIERQVIDHQELARQQAELLKVQSGQLELQRQQLDGQRAAIEDQIRANARQAGVLELQASELCESLDQRKREAEERRGAQASMVFLWEEKGAFNPPDEPPVPSVIAHVVNTSDQPAYDAELYWRRGSAMYDRARCSSSLSCPPIRASRRLFRSTSSWMTLCCPGSWTLCCPGSWRRCRSSRTRATTTPMTRTAKPTQVRMSAHVPALPGACQAKPMAPPITRASATARAAARLLTARRYCLQRR